MATVSWKPPSDILPGDHSAYRLTEWLGSGGMGTVYKAVAPTRLPDMELAVKFLTVPSLADTALFEQFKLEAQIGLTVRHQYISNTHEFLDLRGWDGWVPAAIVMAYHETSLQRVLCDLKQTRQQLPPDVVPAITFQLSQALFELHTVHRLVHRDIKPSNVLVWLPGGHRYVGPHSLTGGKAVLADFGVACTVGAQPNLQLKQDGWKPAELFDANGDSLRYHRATAAEDIFAFGKLLQTVGRANCI